MEALIAKARFHFHERLFETNTLTLTKAGIVSNADTSSRGSKAISKEIVDILVKEQHHKINTILIKIFCIANLYIQFIFYLI